MSAWTHAVCDPCYSTLRPGRQPYKVIGQSDECCWCRNPTDGIYLRMDPQDGPPCRGEGGTHEDDA